MIYILDYNLETLLYPDNSKITWAIKSFQAGTILMLLLRVLEIIGFMRGLKLTDKLLKTFGNLGLCEKYSIRAIDFIGNILP